MKLKKNIIYFLCAVLAGAGTSKLYCTIPERENIEITISEASVCENEHCYQDTSLQNFIIVPDVYATGYYCIYNSEMEGSQKISAAISNKTYGLKASFLYGGYGVAMQGTGRTGPDGDYIKYNGGGGCFIYISGPNAGKNINGKYVENIKTIRKRYKKIGITDFEGFGNLALAHPEKAKFSCSPQIYGSSGSDLTPWYSIAVSPSLLDSGQSCKLLFKDGSTTPCSDTSAIFKAEDTGGGIKGKHIDIYVGEGQVAWNQWLQTGGNRYVDIYITD